MKFSEFRDRSVRILWYTSYRNEAHLQKENVWFFFTSVIVKPSFSYFLPCIIVAALLGLVFILLH